MQQDETGTRHPEPLVLNGPSQFLQCFAIMLSIHCFTSGQEVDEENACLFQNMWTSSSVPTNSAWISTCREINCDANGLTAAWFLGYCVQPMFHHLWWSGLETHHYHHSTTAEMLMLTPCALLCVLVSVALASTWHTIFSTAGAPWQFVQHGGGNDCWVS